MKSMYRVVLVNSITRLVSCTNYEYFQDGKVVRFHNKDSVSGKSTVLIDFMTANVISIEKVREASDGLGQELPQ